MDSARNIDPASEISGRILIAVPHMDDAVLGCGSMLSLLPRKENVKIVYATDGRRMVGRPKTDHTDFNRVDINSVRKSESLAALSKLGFTAEQLTFLDLPEGYLKRDGNALRTALEQLELSSYDHVFTPFRLDKHKDHIALSKMVIDIANGNGDAVIWEYFVYHKWRLIKGGDIRKHLCTDKLFRVDCSPTSELKREALDCFVSQTTNYYPWMSRPVLSSDLLDEYSGSPEFFLKGLPPLYEILPRHTFYEFINELEPRLKNLKERLRMFYHKKRSVNQF